MSLFMDFSLKIVVAEAEAFGRHVAPSCRWSHYWQILLANFGSFWEHYLLESALKLERVKPMQSPQPSTNTPVNGIPYATRHAYVDVSVT
jgi:hypothetical protein